MSAGQADSPHSTHTHARARSSYGVINTVPPLHVYVSINGHRGNVLSPAQMSLLWILFFNSNFVYAMQPSVACCHCTDVHSRYFRMFSHLFRKKYIYFKQDEETFLSHCVTVTVTQLSSKPTWSSILFQLNSLP